jgi:glutamate synthase domain-containing protein 2
VCGADRSHLVAQGKEGKGAADKPDTIDAVLLRGGYLADWRRTEDDTEPYLADIQQIAQTGESVFEPMRTKKDVISWDSILIKGAQLARFPKNHDEPVSTRTIIGRGALHPLILETPIIVSHMSFGALSREAQLAIAKGTAAVKTAMGSGEGGMLPDVRSAAYRYIFEYVPNRYSATPENLAAVDAVEIKFGQSTHPGMGAHLPGLKVTPEIGAIRGYPPGTDIRSPARFRDIATHEEVREKVAWLREKSGGKPVGIKIAAGNVEEDLRVAIHADPDFITLDGRPGATGSAPKFIKQAMSVPTVYALRRARRFLDREGRADIALIITGGLRVSSDFTKALAMGADAVALGTAALIAIGCQQYRLCNADLCPVGITTQNPELRSRFSVDLSARRLENFLRVMTEEVCTITRMTGNDNVHSLSVHDLCTTSTDVAQYTDIPHV